MRRVTHRRAATLVCLGVLASMGLPSASLAVSDSGVATRSASAGGQAAGPCGESVATMVPQPTAARLAAAGLDRLPIAPQSERVDLVAPPFSNPTAVTNPLFPISDLSSAVLNGRVDGKRFRTETTVLPGTRIVEWADGQCVEVLVSQYVAYLDGRIEEVALDLYAQAADGSVWYFGEDVFNYEDGDVADLAGTWHAGNEGPAAMIMPGNPEVGDVYRPENIAGLVFEEVTVTEIGVTVAGPRGPVPGAIAVEELHDDGTREEKLFAPGYGEFFTGSGGDVEAMALAVSADVLPGPLPADLGILTNGAGDVFDAAGAGAWAKASAAVKRMSAAWASHRRAGDVPPRLVAPMNRALKALTAAIDDRNRSDARQAAIDVAQAGLDLQLQHRPVTEIDLRRFDLWLRQLHLDAQNRDTSAVAGDVATLEWIRDRITQAVDSVDLTRLDTGLRDLRSSVGDEDLTAAGRTAAGLRKLLARLD